MSGAKRTFLDLSFEEKLTLIIDYLGSIKPTDRVETLMERMEWLRRHIPAHKTDDGNNYVFISYSHRDYNKVYNDLAFFSYNTRKKVRFWYDEGLPAGDDWFLAAEKRLSDPNCSGVIFYLSENLLRSPAVLREIELVKRLNKPYFTITLDNQKFCAADYLDAVKDAELLSKVESVFPRDDTAVSYGANSTEIFDGKSNLEVYDDEYENAFYRIQKIEQAFSVVEEVLSDFVFEEVEGGLSLVEYRGDETDIYIPSRVGKTKVVEIKAAFNNATKIFIPETVERILPAEIKDAKIVYDIEDVNTMSFEAIYDVRLGGIPLPSAPFGFAANLVSVEVDKDNPEFYSIEGIIYKKDKRLVRFPSKLVWEDRFFEGVEIIGAGAFLGYENPGAQIIIPDSVTKIEDSAFAYAKVCFIVMEDSVTVIERLAFAHCRFSEMEGISFPMIIPHKIESIGEFSFMHFNSDYLSINGNLQVIPKGAFYGCMADTVEMSSLDKLQLIGPGAFAHCKKLEKVHMPKNLVCIDHYAFNTCDRLFSIDIPKKTLLISPMAFDTSGVIKYIMYEGSSKDLFYLRLTSDIEQAEFLDLIVKKDQWFKWAHAKLEIKSRERTKKRYEKMYEVDSARLEKTNKPFILSRITPPTIIYFVLSILLLLVCDYRRLVLEIPLDPIYWILGIAGAVTSVMSAKHLYWSIVVKKTKKSIKKNNGKLTTGFLDAWTDVLAIGLLVFAVVAFIVTFIISGVFNISIF